jgi:hypothetical protein
VGTGGFLLHLRMRICVVCLSFRLCSGVLSVLGTVCHTLLQAYDGRSGPTPRRTMGGAKSLPTDYQPVAHLRLVTSRALPDPGGPRDERRVLRGISASIPPFIPIRRAGSSSRPATYRVACRERSIAGWSRDVLQETNGPIPESIR